MITMSSAMQRPSFKSLIICALGAATLLLSGCAALRFGYNQAPEFTYWWADRYIDFDETQSPKVKEELAGWFRWHRTQQLPGYAQRLAQAGIEVTEPTTTAKVCAFYDDVMARAPVSFDRALPPLADLALSLQPQQIKNIAKRFEKVNKDHKSEHMQDNRDERIDAEVERIEDRLKLLYGGIDKSQRERLRKQVAASPMDAEVAFAERRQRQQDLLALLRRVTTERATPKQTQAALRTWFDNARKSPREGYRAQAEEVKAYNCGMFADLHNSTTPEQRQTAVKKLKGWETDLRVLSGTSPS
jgi:hypothetical protein